MMSKSLFIGKALVTLVDTSFNCPKCEKPHTESFWYDAYYKSKTGVIYKSCNGCKEKLGITTDIKGDVVVWLKSLEVN